jgi:hypothetical protein
MKLEIHRVVRPYGDEYACRVIGARTPVAFSAWSHDEIATKLSRHGYFRQGAIVTLSAMSFANVIRREDFASSIPRARKVAYRGL